MEQFVLWLEKNKGDITEANCLMVDTKKAREIYDKIAAVYPNISETKCSEICYDVVKRFLESKQNNAFIIAEIDQLDECVTDEEGTIVLYDDDSNYICVF